MKTVRTVEELRRGVAAARGQGAIIGFVPTMGSLHEGHLALVDEARRHAGLVVLSIFVNPLQFGPGEDFEAYPRDEARDAELAGARGVDLLYAPTVEEVYPKGDLAVGVVPKRLVDRLCGLSRPGHFEGVLTVVAKLFGMVQPDVAVFGQKDWQQATLIRRMATDLDMGVEVVVAPIVREEDGLALSSRNTYLSAPQRERALSLSRGLFAARDAFAEGVTDAERLKARVRGTMREADVEPEYIELVDPETLDPLGEAGPGAVLAIAARVGDTRLIDNLILGH
ncbi:MAG TPA: pantoate--beta-alanine ligase [Longimicrobiales bacterium]|nr:pantoate--beta-alanine ligase [Longimicrobiales bacterium]